MKHGLLALVALMLAGCGEDGVNVQSQSPDQIVFAYQGATPPEAVRKRAAEHCARSGKASELAESHAVTHSTFVATYRCVAQ